MKLYSENNFYKLYQGSMLDMLDYIEENSIDSIVTDPPYELNFMGKGWDNAGVSFQPDTWKKCYDVLKPGGYLLAFGGSRTFHRIACAIEDAGFEMRDTIMWLYGSGFPKSMDIEKALNKRDGVKFRSKPASGVGFMNTNDDGYHNTIHQLEQIEDSSERAKQWHGWGTCLKPSFEPIIVARKPFKGNQKASRQAWRIDIYEMPFRAARRGNRADHRRKPRIYLWDQAAPLSFKNRSRRPKAGAGLQACSQVFAPGGLSYGRLRRGGVDTPVQCGKGSPGA